MQMANVSFKNSMAADVQIFYKLQGRMAGDCIELAALATSPVISGTLLTIDFVYQGERTSYDFTRYLPKGLWVEQESPYDLTFVIDKDRKTKLLLIRDNRKRKVDEFRPARIKS